MNIQEKKEKLIFSPLLRNVSIVMIAVGMSPLFTPSLPILRKRGPIICLTIIFFWHWPLGLPFSTPCNILHNRAGRRD
jgi:hypothetical protein